MSPSLLQPHISFTPYRTTGGDSHVLWSIMLPVPITEAARLAPWILGLLGVGEAAVAQARYRQVYLHVSFASGRRGCSAAKAKSRRLSGAAPAFQQQEVPRSESLQDLGLYPA